MPMRLKQCIRFCLIVPFINVVLGSVGSYGDTTDIVLGVLLPYTGSWPIGSKIASAASIAIDDIQNDPALLPNRSIGFLWNDTRCNAGDGLYEVVDLWSHGLVLHLHGFIGAGCDSVCEPSGLLTAAWDLPMISWGCTSSSMSNKLNYPTFVRTVGPYFRCAPMIVELFHRFEWSRAAIITSSEHSWQLTSSEVRTSLEDAGVEISQYSSFEPGNEHLVYGTEDTHYTTLEKTKDEARIILLFAYGGDVRDVMLYAYDFGMINGDYIFFTVDLYENSFIGNNTWMGDDGRDDDAHQAFGSIFNIHILEPDTQKYKNFTEEVRRRMAVTPFNDPLEEDSTVDVHAGLLYDAMYLYAVALHAVLEAGEDELSGNDIVRKLFNRTFEGMSGKVTIDEHGDRIPDFALQDFNEMSGYFYDIAEYYSDSSVFKYNENVVIIWPSGSTEVPKDHPDCGWNNEFCQSTIDIASLAGGLVGAGIALILIAVATVNYRRMKYESSLKDINMWLINYSEIDFPLNKSRSIFRSHLTSNYSSKNISNKSITTGKTQAIENRPTSVQSGMNSSLFGGSQKFCKVGYYKGNRVAIKQVRKSSITIDRELLVEMKQMIDLQHTNINRFVGACTIAPDICYVMIYCNKGSLADVLENTDISIDENFKLSFASDIIQGLEFLSQSPMKKHGNLKSSNCVVDSHWVCKLTDFGLTQFRRNEEIDTEEDENITCRQLFWTAPELLRFKPVLEVHGDVYAFGIILQEIVLRTGPFSSMLEVVEPKDIIESVRLGTVPNVRPVIPVDACKRQMLLLIKSCWDEEPTKRPTYSKIKSELKKISGGKSINIVDNMISMMEKYANNLEELVHDRTLELEEEKHKTDQLLYQMLPRSVADQLKKGLQVEAEYFEEVTIYFSDIVGFTKLASESTPLQVVAMLNDLYTAFDDVIDHYNVYKVETIGDAYMVVSGLPERISNYHAGEIAGMALALLNKVKHFSIRHRPGHRMQLRVGIHSGSVVAGIVGLKMPRYCLFGDTVNTASRMESSGLAMMVHVSSATHNILSKFDTFNMEKRGEITVKGKKPLTTFWLKGRKDGSEFELPEITLAAPSLDNCSTV